VTALIGTLDVDDSRKDAWNDGDPRLLARVAAELARCARPHKAASDAEAEGVIGVG
jgi:hypothetical protein